MSTQTMRIVMFAVAALQPNPNNPRKDIEAEDLSEDIKRRGVLCPLLVRPVGTGHQVANAALAMLRAEFLWRFELLRSRQRQPILIVPEPLLPATISQSNA